MIHYEILRGQNFLYGMSKTEIIVNYDYLCQGVDLLDVHKYFRNFARSLQMRLIDRNSND